MSNKKMYQPQYNNSAIKVSIGIFILVSLPGCGLTRLLDADFRRDLGTLARLGKQAQTGVPNYYTEKEQAERMEYFVKDMEKVRQISRKYARN